MCKYCMWRTVKETIGEKCNDTQTIAKIKDGSQTFEVGLTRYACESENIRNAELWLNYTIDVGGSTLPVKDKFIKIKYCPFCGEEL